MTDASRSYPTLRWTDPDRRARRISTSHPAVGLTEEALRARALPTVIYLATALFACGAGGVLSSWVRSGKPLALGVGSAYLLSTALLLVAIAVMRGGRALLASRLAIVAWLAGATGVGLIGETVAAIGLTPPTLAVAIGFATMFDTLGVLRWTAASAGLCALIMVGRQTLHPGELPDPNAAGLLVAVPSVLLVILGLACQAVVRNRDLALGRALDFGDSLQRANVQLELRYQETIAARLAADEAEQASRAKSSFLAHMSHELRTPLNAIIGYAEFLREEIAEQGLPQIEQDLGRMEAASRHLLQVIGDILDLSKIEAGQLRLQPARFDLLALVHELAGVMRPDIERRGNTLALDLDLGGDPTLFADSVAVRQILFNVLANACKFTERGSIRVAARRVGGFVELRVADSGIGMTPEQVARVFVPFAQGDINVARRYGGTGLGMSITRHLVAMMSGTLGIDSAPGVGTAFTIRLPAP